MSRSIVNTLIVILLAFLTAVTLLLNIDLGAASSYAGSAVLFGLLTAFTLYFGVLLAEGELSPAHTVGMVAFLSSPLEARPLMAWAIFIGGLVGGVLLAARAPDMIVRRRAVRQLSTIIIISARVTLSFLVAGELYLRLGGILPLESPLQNVTLPLVLFSIVYTLVYVVIFLLETYSDGRSLRRMLRENVLPFFTILVLPLPFVVIAALVINIAATALVIYAIGMALVSLGLYGLSRAQYRLQKQVREQQSLSIVSQAMQSELNLKALLQVIYNQVSSLLRVNNFVVALYDRETNHLTFPLVIVKGESSRQDAQIKPGNTLLNYVLQTRLPLLIQENVTERASEMGLLPPDPEVHSWLGVPLLAGGRLLGAMVVKSNHEDHFFTADDLRILSTVAASASVTIDNAQLYTEQTARANQMNTLNRVLSLLTGTLSPEEVMDVILSSASVVTEATGVAVYLFWDESHSTLALVRSAGMSDHFSSDPPAPLLTNLHQKPIIINDVTTDSRALSYRPIMAQEGKAAWVELPLSVGELGLGTLLLYFDGPQALTDEGLEIMRAFANQSAQAIKNARLYTTTDKALERRADQMFALASLGRQLTATMNLRSICNLVLSYALEFSQSGTGFIVLKDNDTLSVTAQSGYPPGFTVDAGMVEGSLTGNVLQTGQALHSNDVRKNLPLTAMLSATRSQLTIPIMRGSQTIGAISLESDRIAAFSQEDSYFVTQLANQTTIAIDNTRLFERIDEARDRLQVIVNAMTEAIIVIDKSGVITLANPRVDIIDMHHNQLLNQNIEDLLERPDLDLAERMGFQSDQKVRKLVKELRTPSYAITEEPASYTVQVGPSVMYIHREIIAIRSEAGESIGVLLVFYDQTEERELEQMREDVSRMIVHDLRSPLTAVTTGLKLMRDIIPSDSPYRSMIETTTETSQRAIRKLLSRVDSLLDISRLEAGQINLETEPTELATLADSVCIELSPLAHELDVTLTSQVADALPLLDIDPDKVERIIQNLVDNALKFTPGNGSVTIRSHKPGQNGAPENFVRVDVADSGPGIPDEYKTRLFDRFVQIQGRRGARRGSGLGLTFCRLVVEAQGGRIWIEDNPTGGSVFSFTLPVSMTKRLDETGEWPAAQ